jgi:hypothetical protein
MKTCRFFYLHIYYQTNFFNVFLNYTDPSDPDLPHSFKQCYESLDVLSVLIEVKDWIRIGMKCIRIHNTFK